MTMIDPAQFKQGMRHLAAGVTMITTIDEGRPHGLIATAVCSVSAEPPTLLICVNRSGGTHDAIARSGKFCVNVLESEQGEIARRFLAAARDERFNVCAWSALETGAPAIDGCLASFDCRVANALQSGTHTVFFGHVVALRAAPGGPPLLYHNGDYATLAQQREAS